MVNEVRNPYCKDERTVVRCCVCDKHVAMGDLYCVDTSKISSYKPYCSSKCYIDDGKTIRLKTMTEDAGYQYCDFHINKEGLQFIPSKQTLDGKITWDSLKRLMNEIGV